MTLLLENMDEITRKFMLDELKKDEDKESIYLSSRLNEKGREEYPELLRQAIQNGDDASLVNELNKNNVFLSHEQRKKPKGGFTTVRVPITAAQTLAEGEFNRFYMRGLCQRAIKEGIKSLEVYRAKEVASPRSESIRMIGNLVNPEELLNDLRKNVGVDTALGLPPGPNSGLSVKIPTQ